MGLLLRRCAQAVGVEDVGLNFSLAALDGDFFAVQQEGHAGGVSSSDNDFVSGADGSLRGRDQGFVGYGFAIGRERNPSGLLGADEQGESGGRLYCGGLYCADPGGGVRGWRLDI